MKSSKLLALVSWGLLSILTAFAAPAGKPNSQSITVDGKLRTYLLQVPSRVDPAGPIPLVLAFHGANGSGASIMEKFRRIADKEGFLLCCPDGMNKWWNAGPASEVEATGGADDVKFVSELIEEIAGKYNVDRRRIFACGMSNGAALSHTLGVRLSDKIAAIAPVAATLPKASAEMIAKSGPMPVLQIIGSLDNVVHREGLLELKESCEKWVAHNGCEPNPQTVEWPDRDPTDGTRVIESVWRPILGDAVVRLLLVEGGRHAWPIGPGGVQAPGRQPASLEFDAGEEIWRFFRDHPKLIPDK